MGLETLCYLRDNGRTLMILHNGGPEQFFYGVWNGLGGKIEQGEAPLDNVIREVKEESGLIIKNPKLKGMMIHINLFGVDHYVFNYVATEFEGTLRENKREGILRWVDDICTLNLWKSDRLWLPLLDQDRFFIAEFRYDEKAEIIKHDITLY
ncbi:DNA mismatch repair protein MutT [Candidatus Woesearchaeota archaeon CG10_big_fil_rev_8_21_14_0_10_44_13]|nr:MAG: DNA mismatch repair protein MutT [Candidatus Woesearchaeota archaeon CG10_big_fil_rev_8_21_14_0_10_44_13]